MAICCRTRVPGVGGIPIARRELHLVAPASTNDVASAILFALEFLDSSFSPGSPEPSRDSLERTAGPARYPAPWFERGIVSEPSIALSPQSIGIRHAGNPTRFRSRAAFCSHKANKGTRGRAAEPQ